jgi:ribosomal protein L3 glutamine methyltransferase
MAKIIEPALLTIRDHLRFAVSRFNAAKLAYGHGTANALDEAAFIILETLNLPIDQLEPWLACRLTDAERARVQEAIARRVKSRLPAPYIVGAAYIQGHRFTVDERVIVPRSYVGELIATGALGDLVGETLRILELCTGSGCLAILAALAFEEATVDATEISSEALAVARRNVADYGLGERVRLLQGDLFDPVVEHRYDLIIANPPYVTDTAVAAFPPEHRAEPRVAHAGGADGLDLVRRILERAGDHLEPDGAVIVEVGQAREALEAAYPELPFLWLDTEGSEGEVFLLRAGDLAPGEPSKSRRKTG